MKEESFEIKMEKLEKIALDLEKGNLNLDESVKLFEEGIKISKECSEFLENAEKKIKVLLESNGEIKEEDFEVKD